MSNPPSIEIQEQIIALYEAGKTKTEIQIETSVSLPTIRRILDTAGYPPKDMPRTEITKEIEEQIVALQKKGFSAGKIGEQLGIAKRTALNVLANHAHNLKGHGEAISSYAFIKAWQENNSVEDVAVKLGMTVHGVISRAYTYRLKGVPLKRYPSAMRGYDWSELAEFAELFDGDASAEEE